MHSKASHVQGKDKNINKKEVTISNQINQILFPFYRR